MKKNLLYLLVASVFLFTGCDGGGSDFKLEADAGADQNVATGEIVTLDASDSYTSSKLTLSYNWEFASIPSGSSAVLSDPDSVQPTFSADVDGIYIVNVVVSDSLDRSNIDSVTITASSGNSAPVADAGVDQNVSIAALVTLDGSASSDANSDPLTYLWSFFSTPNGVNVILNDATTAKPTFKADVEGIYDIQLIVNDGTTDSVPDIVTVIASAANSAPVADAGVNQNVSTGDTVTLDGSGSSDADNDLLTYVWTITSAPQGSTASLTDSTVVSPNFVADLDGSYVVQLVVNDGTIDSIPSTTTITASTANSAPIADAGVDQNVSTGDTVTLDGSGSSDADSDPLTYSWALTSVPANSNASLSDSTVQKPTFAADLDGTYVAQLTVNDGLLDSAPVSVTVTASTGNSTPVANAGTDQDVSIGDTVTLDSSGSSDADGDTLTYSWKFNSLPANSTATLSDSTAPDPTFVADLEGDYVAQLIVNDGTVDSAMDTVTITATLSEDTISHNGLTYKEVTSPSTGRTWLDRNLGASRACTAIDDIDCFGDYYQWGRLTDGHEKNNSSITTALAADVANAGSDFIATSGYSLPYDWASDGIGTTIARQDQWGAIDGSSICPVGYRAPRFDETNAEIGNFIDPNDALNSAFNSFLKLPTAGRRGLDGSMVFNQQVRLWSTSVITPGYSYNNIIFSTGYSQGDASRGVGLNVRCIKD